MMDYECVGWRMLIIIGRFWGHFYYGHCVHIERPAV